MSNRIYPTYGYLVPIENILAIIQDAAVRTELQVILDRDDRMVDDLEEFEEKIKPVLEAQGLPPLGGSLLVADEEQASELDAGVYAWFDEKDLFVMDKKPGLEKLIELGVTPEVQCWTNFG